MALPLSSLRVRSVLAWGLTGLLGAAAAFAQEGGGGPVVPPQPPGPVQPPAPGTTPPQPGQPLPAPGPGGGSQAGGLRTGREQMWPAPTAEDWAKPCLITWQRTWDDAVAVLEGDGQPILVCINMDGEIASEHYAGVRYRQPEIAALYEPYVLRDRVGLPPQPARLRRRRAGASPARASAASPAASTSRIEPVDLREVLRRAARRARATSWSSSTGKERLRRLLPQRHRLGASPTSRRASPKRPAAARARSCAATGPSSSASASRDVSDRAAVEAAYAQGDAAAAPRAARGGAQARRRGAARPAAPRGLRPRSRRSRSRRARRSRRRRTRRRDRLIAEALSRAPWTPAERDALLGALKRLGETSRARALARGGPPGPRRHGPPRSTRRVDAAGQAAGAPPPTRLDGLEAAAPARRKAAATATPSRTRRRSSSSPRRRSRSRCEAPQHLRRPTRASARGSSSAPLRRRAPAAREAERLGATGWRLERRARRSRPTTRATSRRPTRARPRPP